MTDAVVVEMKVTRQIGETGSGYPQWETLAEFTLPAETAEAFAIFQQALARTVARTEEP